MTQEEIVDILSESELPLSAQQITELIDSSIKAVRQALNKLEKHHEVEKIKLSKEEVCSRHVRYAGRHFVWKLVLE